MPAAHVTQAVLAAAVHLAQVGSQLSQIALLPWRETKVPISGQFATQSAPFRNGVPSGGHVMQSVGPGPQVAHIESHGAQVVGPAAYFPSGVQLA